MISHRMWAALSHWIAKLASSPAINWKAVLIAGYVIDVSFKNYLYFRQYRAQSRESPPEDAVKEGLVDLATYKKSQQYERANLRIPFTKRAVETVLRSLVINYNVWPAVFNFWKRALSSTRFASVSIAGFLTLGTIQFSYSILSKPFVYYAIFGVEEQFGFNTSTVGLWIKDTIKMYTVAWVLTPLIVLPMEAIIKYFGDSFVPYLGLFLAAFSVAQSFLIPAIVLPWFNKYTLLEDGELKNSIEKLAGSLDFPVKRIYVEDASVRSNHDNAYFIGSPWSKQIVLYDTLIKNYSVEEVTAVVAHELGHWKLNHMAVHLGIEQLTYLPVFVLLSAFVNNSHFYESLGFDKGDTPIAIAFLTLLSPDPLSTSFQFFASYLIRSCEYAADRFAVNLKFGKPLREGLIKMSSKSLTTLDYDTLYSTFHDSHPRTLERLRAIDTNIKKVS